MKYQKIPKFRKNCNKIIQRKLVLKKIKKYLTWKYRKINTNNYWQSKINYNSIIMEYQKVINLLNNTPINQLNLGQKTELK